MDLCSVSVKNNNQSPYLLTRTMSNKNLESARTRNSLKKLGKLGSLRVFEIRVSKGSSYSRSWERPLSVRAMAKKNRDNPSHSSSSGDGDRSVPEGNGPDEKYNSAGANKSNEDLSLDWRQFRASLFAQEQAEKVNSDEKLGQSSKSQPLGLKWAHPIAVPETGCVLVATEKLDGVHTFERTVVLLLRSGTRHPQEGPFGVVINRPLHKKIKHMKPTNLDLATTFADCSVHFGGPLEASMFLLKSGERSLIPRFEEVMPGLCFGARNSLDDAAGLVNKGTVKPEDFRFFFGYAGWQLDQLREEIESDYWYVASCSPNLIYGGSPNSSEKLWEEILQLMGGHYSELSRKPKQDM